MHYCVKEGYNFNFRGKLWIFSGNIWGQTCKMWGNLYQTCIISGLRIGLLDNSDGIIDNYSKEIIHCFEAGYFFCEIKNFKKRF